MGRKNIQPNAPELTDILLSSQGDSNPSNSQQQRGNMYGASSQSYQYSMPPPPYKDNVPRLNNQSSVHYPLIAQPPLPNQPLIYPQHPTTRVTIQQPPTVFIYAPSMSSRVRKFNIDLFFLSICSIASTIISLHLYAKRNCHDYIIIQLFGKNLTFNNLFDLHRTTVFLSLLLLGVSLVQCCSCDSPNSRQTSYRAIVIVLTFVGALLTGLIAYMSFYATCSTVLEFIQTGMDIVTLLTGKKLPDPESLILGKQNVFDVPMDRDPYGRITFFNTVFNSIIHLSAFFTILTL